GADGGRPDRLVPARDGELQGAEGGGVRTGPAAERERQGGEGGPQTAVVTAPDAGALRTAAPASTRCGPCCGCVGSVPAGAGEAPERRQPAGASAMTTASTNQNSSSIRSRLAG